MAWTSNHSQIAAAFEAKKREIDAKVEAAANKALVLGLNNVQNLCPVDTSNLKDSYPRCSTVEKTGEAQRRITWTSDVDYQIFQEMGTSKMAAHPHLRPGIHAALPAIQEAFKEALNER
jgi:HK97 gp10 family phage protein